MDGIWHVRRADIWMENDNNDYCTRTRGRLLKRASWPTNLMLNAPSNSFAQCSFRNIILTCRNFDHSKAHQPCCGACCLWCDVGIDPSQVLGRWICFQSALHALNALIELTFSYHKEREMSCSGAILCIAICNSGSDAIDRFITGSSVRLGRIPPDRAGPLRSKSYNT